MPLPLNENKGAPKKYVALSLAENTNKGVGKVITGCGHPFKTFTSKATIQSMVKLFKVIPGLTRNLSLIRRIEKVSGSSPERHRKIVTECEHFVNGSVRII